MLPLVPEGLPDLHGVPVYMANGHNDRLIPTDEANQLASMLEDASAEVTHRWSDARHGLAQGELGPIREWLADHEPTFAKPRSEAR
jgi:phospholipase/carboxylesterase